MICLLTIPAVANNMLLSSSEWCPERKMTDQTQTSNVTNIYVLNSETINFISRVLPYIIDLGSANGTYLNNNKIEPQRYYELKEKDMVKFGFSTREYVLLHENSGE